MNERPRGEDPVPDAEIDRQFAELIARYHEGAERTDPGSAPTRPVLEPPDRPAAPAPRADWHADHPLFQLPPEPDEVPEPVERYDPGPLEPLPRLSRPALIGALMLTTSVLIALLAVLGLPFPAWVGWLAITGFTIGLVVLLSRLPRHRDPDDGDGAVL